MIEQQEHAYNYAVHYSKNIFITSSAGCGKTWILKKIYNDLSKNKNVALTSLTGISANIIGGQTLHSYLGIRLGKGSVGKLYNMISNSKKYLNRWKKLEVLLIDEISMLSIELFEKLEILSRKLRKNDKVFGGIQLVFAGDFLQLRPVKQNDFCFESPYWKKCIEHTIYLKKIIRQSDVKFAQILNKIRLAELDSDCKETLEKRVIKYNKNNHNGLIPTTLFSTNNVVDRFNIKYYSKLKGKEYVFNISYNWNFKINNKKKYINLCRLSDEIKLKKGAQIIYLVNNPDLNLFNGSRGKVIDFINEKPLVIFNDGKERLLSPYTLTIEENDMEIMEYTQLPVKLAYAMTIHKSQGSTLDLVCINFKNIFEYGQFYVALSRCKSLEGLYLKNIDWSLIKAHPKAVKYYKTLSSC